MKYIKIKLDEKEPFYIKLFAIGLFMLCPIVLVLGLYLTFHH